MREKQAATNVAAESKHSATLIPADNGMDASNIFISFALLTLFHIKNAYLFYHFYFFPICHKQMNKFIFAIIW